MENLLTYIITSITGLKKVDIEKNDENGLILYSIKIPPDVVGLVIGKEGRCIKAIRTLLKVRATLENVRADLNILPLE